MFFHAYENYMDFGFPMDEVRPLTCKGRNTLGGFALTLVDSLDTLMVRPLLVVVAGWACGDDRPFVYWVQRVCGQIWAVSLLWTDR